VVGMLCASDHRKMGQDYEIARATLNVKQYLETVRFELER
jgi:hypothetical protein